MNTAKFNTAAVHGGVKIDHETGGMISFTGEGFFRLSIGLEDPEDLCTELGGVFDAAARSVQ